jgi:hypothetical protein
LTENNRSPTQGATVSNGGFLSFYFYFVHELRLVVKDVTDMENNTCGNSAVLKATLESK